LITPAGGETTQNEQQPNSEQPSGESEQEAQQPNENIQQEPTPAAEKPDAATVKKHMTPAQLALGDPVINSVGMLLVPISAGDFQMGSPDSDSDAEDDEKPQHLVKITKPFYLGVYEVTQQQYQKVMGDRPWQGKSHLKEGGEGLSRTYVKEGPDYPAVWVTHDDAVEFFRKLSEQEDVEYRLPTEAEWESACRAGITTVFSFGDDASKLGQYAWYDENAWDIGEDYAHRVGQKQPKPWGLYDMHGNGVRTGTHPTAVRRLSVIRWVQHKANAV
jgi:formylglycine-generating enzyme required for sulfatase activity